MGACILVLALPRSGSSTVAGVLQHLGVDMGAEQLGPDRYNPKGYFEDTDFLRLNEQVVGNWRRPEINPTPEQMVIYKKLAEQRRHKPIWGTKDPRWCFTASFLIPYLEDFAVILTRRDPQAMAQSLMACYGMPALEASQIVDRYVAAQESVLDKIHADHPGIKIKSVQYEELVQHPAGIVTVISLFLEDVCPELHILPRSFRQAIEFVDPTLRHF
ncbi:MAG: hypothetical protein D6706_19000 [Chloroflexi bacterium]|nr:MAG: hypothetical protein D6706_19000 [Chloroflexota bacterium]